MKEIYMGLYISTDLLLGAGAVKKYPTAGSLSVV
ncbi:hypothetical protein DENIT_220002 [Pseudomonas veronii]|nr:hypothetical protein DENIT_220002 [Pseudomonas veronii]